MFAPVPGPVISGDRRGIFLCFVCGGVWPAAWVARERLSRRPACVFGRGESARGGPIPYILSYVRNTYVFVPVLDRLGVAERSRCSDARRNILCGAITEIILISVQMQRFESSWFIGKQGFSKIRVYDFRFTDIQISIDRPRLVLLLCGLYLKPGYENSIE